MTAIQPTLVEASQMHRFTGGERNFAFLVPSSMIFELDETTETVLDRLEQGPQPPAAVARTPEERDALRELAGVGAVTRQGTPLIPLGGLQEVDGPPPIRTVVLNITNSCNLACRYCYEYGDDRIAEAEVPAAMSEEVARQSVDRLISDSGNAKDLQVTFFGGETLLNWRVIRPTVEYAREQAAQAGKRVDFSLTTNATLLTREISEWIADNGIGVTISVDGPKEFQDSMRVYGSGMGSYDVIAPRIEQFLSVQKRPVGARVTITAKNLDVRRIFDHLIGLGFYEVGFAPVTSSPDQDYALGDDGFDDLLDQFRDLASDYVEQAVEGRYLGFSNLSDLLGEIHEGVSKAYPCGAGLGLVGVAPGGEIGLCHRFAGSGDHDLGHVATGIDDDKRAEHLEKAHIDARTDCSQCWVRSLCSGGCYHEAQVRYGDRFRPNLHYCDWIRDWTALGLSAYGQILDRAPRFLHRFEGMLQAARQTP